LGYGRILVRRPIPPRFWSHLRHRDAGTEEINAADVTLLDDLGRELVSITDFTLRRIDVDGLTESITAVGSAAIAGRNIAGTPAGSGETLTGGAASTGIRPADGAEAFRRTVATDLGPQVIISVMPINEIIASSRQFNQQTIEGDLDSPGTGPLTVGAERSAADGFVAPRTELEAAIARIWGDIIGAEIGVTDDFFEIGGNSLIAVQLIALVRKEFGVRLPMRSIFETPTVAGTAALIAQLRGAEATPSGPATTSPIQRLPRRGDNEGEDQR
jgi:acyl carrier protein